MQRRLRATAAATGGYGTGGGNCGEAAAEKLITELLRSPAARADQATT